MEHILNPNTHDTGRNGTDTKNKEFIASKLINRKPPREWGFEVAGLNRGDTAALESHLRWIREGHLVDETHSAEEEGRRKKELEVKATLKEKERAGRETDREHLQNVVIPDKEKQIGAHRGEIEQKKIQMAEGMIQSDYSPARFCLYLVLCCFISIFVLLFYASAINAAFFRSLQQLVDGGSGGDVTLMLNSIFDVNSITQLGPQSLFTYLGAFIFFGFGLLPHIFLHQKGAAATMKAAAAILVCLVVDGLLAYKIDSGIQELKIMMGVSDDDWAWYRSVNFYLVLAFGFGTYILWGFLYEAALVEHHKKNVNARTEIEIRGLLQRIREVEQEILEKKKDLAELQKLIDGLKLEIEGLKKELEAAALRPEELLRNMENFYAGWLGYLNGISENSGNKAACENLYKTFHQSLKQQLN